MRALALLLVLAPLPAAANMASPVQPGTPAGAPAAALDGLRVERETLRIDLTPLERGRPFARIEAVYWIDNPGDLRTVPLEFLALGDDVDAASVRLDGRPIEAERVPRLAVPPAWMAATETPAFEGEPLPYEADAGVGTPSGLRFTLDLAPGRHVVEVAYRVRLGSYDAGDHPNRVWQFAYSLAPARLWAGFDRLDLEIVLPDGWETGTSLPLRAEAGRLVGRFASVPGDVLTVSARAPAPAGRIPLRLAALLGALVVVAFAGVVGGRLVARAGRPVWRAVPVSLLGSVFAAALLVAGVSIADDLGDSSAHGYRTVLSMVFVGGPVAIVVGTLLAQLVAWRTVRRAPPPS
ncbi:MAG: hypothetical protein AAF845_14235 [Bacteroidota bacterium]